MNGSAPLYILILVTIALSSWNLKTTHGLVEAQAITNTHLEHYTQDLEKVEKRLLVLEITKNP